MTNLPGNLHTIIHIGAGRGDELSAYLASDAQRIVLIEPNPTMAENLRQRVRQDRRVEVLEAAITDDENLSQLAVYNLPEANSLYHPDAVRKLFPGLKVIKHYPVRTRKIENLLQSVSLSGERNLLIIQTPGAEHAIINGLIDQEALQQFPYIHLTINQEPLYEGAASAEQLLYLLREQGYDSQPIPDTNPDWPQWMLERNPASQEVKALKLENQALTQSLLQAKSEREDTRSCLDRVESELKDKDVALEGFRKSLREANHQLEVTKAESQTAQDNISEKSERIEALQQQIAQLQEERDRHKRRAESHKTALDETNQRLEAEKAESQAAHDKVSEQSGWIEALKQQSAQLQEDRDEYEKQAQTHNTALHEANQSIQQAENRVIQLQEQVRQLEESLSREASRKKELTELKRSMDYLFGQQRLQLEQAANALGRHVTDTAKTSAKELEAGIALRQQYGPDLPCLEAQGTKLPATIALQLSHHLKSEPYDLIIEMGSGVTTSFMAHTLRKHIVNGDGNDQNSEDAQISHYIDPSEDDLPKRIVCFEHNRSVYNELQDSLKHSGLSPLINLQFAPLVPYIHQGQGYLFYDCAARLQQIAKLFEGRRAHIFILLNQPEGDSQPEPSVALPQVLQYLAAHTLDVVVNANGHVLDQWQALLKERGLEFSTVNEFGSSQVRRLTVNP